MSTERAFYVKIVDDGNQELLEIRDNFGHCYLSELNEPQLVNLRVFMEQS